MGKVKIAKGYFWRFTGGIRKSIETLQEALSLQAKCEPCGCDNCLCYETICNAETGELLVRYYIGADPGPYTEVVEPYDVGIDNLKALKKARD